VTRQRLCSTLLPRLLIAAALHAVAPGGLAAQSEYMDIAQSGGGMKVAFSIDGAGNRYAGIGAAYTINGLLDLGIELAAAPSRGSWPGTDYIGSVTWNVTLLKQDWLIPVSLLLTGAFSRATTVSDQLKAQDLIQTGRGYRIGTEVFRFGFVAHRLYLCLGLAALFESSVSIVERRDGDGTGGYPKAASYQQFGYGPLVRLSYRPNRSDRGIAVSLDLRAYLHPGDPFTLASALNFTLVENKLESKRS
jgi:hypothetical protein